MLDIRILLGPAPVIGPMRHRKQELAPLQSL